MTHSAARAGTVLAIGAVLAATGVLGPSVDHATAAGAPTIAVGAVPHLSPGAAVTGELAPATPISATVTLNPLDPAALETYATEVSTPGNAAYRKFLTPEQFATRFGPATRDITAVSKMLAAAGLNPGAVSANHLAIQVHGSAAALGKTFDTGFEQVRLADGRVARTNTAAPRLPRAIAGTVQAVVGLDTLTQLKPQLLTQPAAAAPRTVRPHVATGGPQPCQAATDGADAYGFQAGYTEDQLASAYSLSGLYGAGDFGSGQTIAMYELYPDLDSDIAAYQTCYGTSAQISYEQVDGGAGSTIVADSAEPTLDIENAIGFAPKANQIVYQAPNDANGPYDLYNQIFSEDKAQIVSVSYGVCEADAVADDIDPVAENTLFQEAATQGQSVIAASGDSGAQGCDDPNGTEDDTVSVDDPAGQPFVTSVGGTTLNDPGPPPNESVWNEYELAGFGGGAGGGGVSSNWPMPSYQSAAAASLGVVNTDSSGTPCGAAAGSYCREVPDVALDGDTFTGYVIDFQGQWQPVGGTSAGAPSWAAITALANAQSACAGGKAGFLNPTLYTAAGSAYAQDFNDVTDGNNDFTQTNGNRFAARTGYDLATGLGTPVATKLAASLCPGQPEKPVLVSLAPTSGPAGGGTKVVVTGTHFTGATSVMFGGVNASSFTVVSDTETDAVTPAESPSRQSVYVTTAGGQSSAATKGTFTFLSPTAPAPSITGVTPSSGDTTGGTTVTITGSYFTGATAVNFGSVAATSFTATSDTQLTAVSPAEAAGSHNIQVKTPTGTSAAVSADQFTFKLPPPAITSITPTSGPLKGGTKVTITGTNLTGATKVSFGSYPAASYTVVSATRITAVTPAEAAGSHNIQIVTPDGTSASVSADVFTFKTPPPAITALTPNSGPTAGGTTVTFTGTNFTGATKVSFGSTPATSFTVISDTQLTAVTPAGTSTHNTQIVTPSGTSPTVPADQFTWTNAT